MGGRDERVDRAWGEGDVLGGGDLREAGGGGGGVERLEAEFGAAGGEGLDDSVRRRRFQGA